MVKKTHGEGRSSDPAYSAYCNMLDRCRNENNKFYSYYGGRGIAVHSDWKGPSGFTRFKEHLGCRPDGMTLDRIDPNGNYEPGNVRWATRTVQLINQNIRADNKSGHKGVHWEKRRSKWMSFITVSKRRKHIGYFESLDEAIAARIDAEIKYFIPILEATR